MLRLATDWPRHPLPRMLLLAIGLSPLGHSATLPSLPAPLPWKQAWYQRLHATPAGRVLAKRSGFSAHATSQTPTPPPDIDPVASSPFSPSSGATPTSVQWLAKLVQAEAGDQPFVTQLAVAAVVLNRTRSGIFPRRIPAVIRQPGQFQPVANGTFATAIPSPSAWTAARTILHGGPNPAPSALYFYNPALTAIPWMTHLIDCVTYGALRFCTGPAPAT